MKSPAFASNGLSSNFSKEIKSPFTTVVFLISPFASVNSWPLLVPNLKLFIVPPFKAIYPLCNTPFTEASSVSPPK